MYSGRNLSSFGNRRGLSPRHVAFPQGHLPSRRLGVVPITATIEDLQQSLTQAIQAEDYQLAAKLRDEIQEHPEQSTSLRREVLKGQLDRALKQEDYAAAAVARDGLSQLPPEEVIESPKELTHKSATSTSGVLVSAMSAYIPARSSPERGLYFFVYKIAIENQSDKVVQLRNRYWSIVDSREHEEEVKGPGVIGQQPVLLPGKKFEYLSACPLKTDSGTMEGVFECIILDDEGEWGDVLNVKIGRFLLTTRVVGQMES